MAHTFDIQIAFYSWWQSSTLPSNLRGRLFLRRVPEDLNISYPYAIYTIVGNPVVIKTRTGSTGGSKYKIANIQVKIYHDNEDDCSKSAKDVVVLIDDETLIVQGSGNGSILSCEVIGDGESIEEETNIFRWLIPIEVLSESTRVR